MRNQKNKPTHDHTRPPFARMNAQHQGTPLEKPLAAAFRKLLHQLSDLLRLHRPSQKQPATASPSGQPIAPAKAEPFNIGL